MYPDEFFLLGKVVKSNGSKGELVFFLDTERTSLYKKLESVFIKIHENLIPFFIESIGIKAKNQALVKLFDIDTVSDAEALVNCELYLPLSMQPKDVKKRINNFDITGYEVIDIHHGPIGFVTNILELPMQELLEINFAGKEVLIPAVKEIIREVDHNSKIIRIEAPEGLINLYL